MLYWRFNDNRITDMTALRGTGGILCVGDLSNQNKISLWASRPRNVTECLKRDIPGPNFTFYLPTRELP